MSKIRSLLKDFLTRLLILVEEKPTRAKRKKPLSLLQIKFSTEFVSSVLFLVFFWILLENFGFSWRNVLGLLLFFLTVMILLSIYVKRCISPILRNPKYLGIAGVVAIISILLMELIHSTRGVSHYLVPIAPAGILLTILVNPHIALVAVLILSTIFGMINNLDLSLFLYGLVGGTGAVYASYNVRHRKDIIRAGLYVSGANMTTICIIYLLKEGKPVLLGTDLVWGIANGFFSVILTLGILPILEEIFSITTAIKLLELSDFNQPLLKKLMLEAPGTYHHSIIVGNLVENASYAIGANSLLGRVAGYYHDIGKLKNPEYFAENQQGLPSKHDDLTPSMSTLVLISHVKDGAQMARESKLPPEIVDIIEQHHGTSLLYYFYRKAMEDNRINKVEEEEYRYPGPKAKTKEAALVMLADAVEAASRALEEPSYERLKSMVDKVINDRFVDGQLNDSSLTLVDLTRIAESFTQTLVGIYHARIEYPERA